MSLRHCALCEHEIKSLELGVICQLTNRKPDFHRTCTTIQLDQKFQEELEIAHLNLELLDKKKNATYLTFYILIIIIGFLLIITSTAIAGLIEYDSLYFWETKLTIIGIGISLLTSAYFKLNKFRDKLSSAAFNKHKIDEVLEKYGIRYKTKIEFKEKIHGTQDVDITITYKNWKKPSTTTTYNMNDI